MPSGSAVMQCGCIGQVKRDSRILFRAVRKCWPQCQALVLLQNTNSMPINY